MNGKATRPMASSELAEASVPAANKAGTVIRIAVLMTCFNRKDKTIACLDSLAASGGLERVERDVFLVDDGSTDGTAASVIECFPKVRVIAGSGDLFWCRGMHAAFAAAMPGDYDYYMWLNDDTMLYADAVARLVSCAESLRATRAAPQIVVGNTIDHSTGQLTYGGHVRASALRRLNFTQVTPGEVPLECDTMNGNVVLVSREAAARVGNLEPSFAHAMGDIDYGLRARRAGVEIWVAPGRHGTCSHNPIDGTFVDPRATLRQRWKSVAGRKGLPWRSWLVMVQRHGGPLWPLLFVWPYLKVVAGRYGR